MASKTLSIIIPCYNEEDSIAVVIQRIPKNSGDIIIVDNNSTDQTSSIARNLGAKIVFEVRRGYGSALKAGLAEARGDILITLDGDGQYPAEKIEEIVNFLEEKKLDFISCSRFPLTNRYSMNFSRILGNKMLTWAANLIFGLKLNDSQSGMWVFRRKILENIRLESDGMSFSEEIKIKAALNLRFKFAEYWIPYYSRIGRSKLMPFKDGLFNLFYLFKLKISYLLNFLSSFFKNNKNS